MGGKGREQRGGKEKLERVKEEEGETFETFFETIYYTLDIEHRLYSIQGICLLRQPM